MLKKIILKSIMAICVLQASYAGAQEREYTPIEGFINRVKTTNTFVTVGDLWQADRNFDQTEMLKSVEKGQPLVIDYMKVAMFMKQKNTAINLVLPGTDGKVYTVELARYDFLSNEFEVHEMGDNGDKKVEYTPGLYYRGVVKGIPGSLAAFSFFNNEVYGIFSIPDEGNYVVAPNTQVGKEYDYNTHYVLYNDNDLKIKHLAPECHTDELPEINRTVANKTTTTLNNKVYNTCKEVNTFETADYSMYIKKGSSTTNCINYITAIFNNKSIIYKNEGIAIVLKYTQVNTSSADPYATLPTSSTSSSFWLKEFGDQTMNVMHGCDVAVLYTTKGGSMGGVAWLSSACSSYDAGSSYGPYAFCNINNSSTLTLTPNFPTYNWEVEVATHELGHTLGSPHTHRCCWNPPARVTAIDRCTTLEGSCANPSPLYPVGGGTIMSYCHMQSVGINFTKGFGQQPGDTVRYFIRSMGSSCGNIYTPTTPLAVANRTISANNECTDLTTFYTYYWKDANTASHADDTLVMMVKKNNNNIGDLNTPGFSVKSTTVAGYAGGSGVNVTFPSGTSGVAAAGGNYAMRRFWEITPIGSTSLTAPVDVILPFLYNDTLDVNGSVPGPSAPMANYRFYKTKSPIDPNPVNNFPTAVSSDISVYSYGSPPSLNKYILLPPVGGTMFAYMKVSNLPGGFGGFYPNGTITSFGNITAESGIEIYPNPTSNDWYVSFKEGNGETVNFQLFSADGRLMLAQEMKTGTVNSVSAVNLATGMYFFRIIGENKVQTGTLMKN